MSHSYKLQLSSCLYFQTNTVPISISVWLYLMSHGSWRGASLSKHPNEKLGVTHLCHRCGSQGVECGFPERHIPARGGRPHGAPGGGAMSGTRCCLSVSYLLEWRDLSFWNGAFPLSSKSFLFTVLIFNWHNIFLLCQLKIDTYLLRGCWYLNMCIRYPMIQWGQLAYPSLQTLIIRAPI